MVIGSPLITFSRHRNVAGEKWAYCNYCYMVLLYPYLVSIPSHESSRTKRFASTFIMHTAEKWNSLPADLFPDKYNLDLFKMPASRPPVQKPVIWRSFSNSRGDFIIQDLTADLFQPALQLLQTYFTRDEPPCRCIGINDHPQACEELKKLWVNTMKDNLSLVCLSGDGRLVGVNVLTVVCKDDKEEPFQSDDKVWSMLFGAVELVSKGVDVFQYYNVDKYLTAYGLVVDPEWRGCSVGKELLLARYKRRLEDSDIRSIVLYVREEQQRIVKLDICYNQITDAGFYKLLKKLLIKGRSSITNLNIMNNELTEKSMLLLAKYATFIKLRYLRINGNDIGTNGGISFAKFLERNKTLEFCDIAETGQTLSSVAYVLTALRKQHGGNDTVKVFDFSRIIPLFNRYNIETKWLAYHIEMLLESNSTIVELHVQKNEFISHDMEYFARGLRINKALLYLDLAYNKIGDYGAELLGKYLSEDPQLILLNLAGNGIKDTGARALSFGLPYSKIRALDVANNKIGDDGLQDLLNTVKKPYFLRFLNIWGNEIGHETCLIIERMLLSGVLFQHTIDVRVYEVDDVLHAAFYQNPADRNKHLYYCEQDYGVAQPIYRVTRNRVYERKKVKVDCKQRHKLDKTSKDDY